VGFSDTHDPFVRGVSRASPTCVDARPCWLYFRPCEPRATGRRASTSHRRSIPVDLDDRLDKRLRRFLRQVVPDAARDEPVGIWTREFVGIGTAVRVRCPIGIPLKHDGEHGDDGPCGQLLFQRVIVPLAFHQAEVVRFQSQRLPSPFGPRPAMQGDGTPTQRLSRVQRAPYPESPTSSCRLSSYGPECLFPTSFACPGSD
jgi:hypothetical protein